MTIKDLLSARRAERINARGRELVRREAISNMAHGLCLELDGDKSEATILTTYSLKGVVLALEVGESTTPILFAPSTTQSPGDAGELEYPGAIILQPGETPADAVDKIRRKIVDAIMASEEEEK